MRNSFHLPNSAALAVAVAALAAASLPAQGAQSSTRATPDVAPAIECGTVATLAEGGGPLNAAERTVLSACQPGANRAAANARGPANALPDAALPADQETKALGG